MLAKLNMLCCRAADTNEQIWLIFQTHRHVLPHRDKSVIHCVPLTLVLHMVQKRAGK